MRPLYIFDLDGTLALTEHRQHLVQCEKPDWPTFFAACVDDQPNEPVLSTLDNLCRIGGRIGVPGEVLGWVGRLCACPPEPPKTPEQRIAELEERVAQLERGPARY